MDLAVLLRRLRLPIDIHLYPRIQGMAILAAGRIGLPLRVLTHVLTTGQTARGIDAPIIFLLGIAGRLQPDSALFRTQRDIVPRDLRPLQMQRVTILRVSAQGDVGTADARALRRCLLLILYRHLGFGSHRSPPAISTIAAAVAGATTQLARPQAALLTMF